ncbi:hypothetical protein, partial [Azohydromonas aeria]|uniref:hypothetical protein n=1 Tax=Azohydromonas aeria TaxID=2590212 RepID=UPI0018DF19DA
LGTAGAGVEAQLLALEALRYGPGADTGARALRRWRREFERAVAAARAAAENSSTAAPTALPAGTAPAREAPGRSR